MAETSTLHVTVPLSAGHGWVHPTMAPKGSPPPAGAGSSSAGVAGALCPDRSIRTPPYRGCIIVATSAAESLIGGCLMTAPFEPLIEYSMLDWPPQT